MDTKLIIVVFYVALAAILYLLATQKVILIGCDCDGSLIVDVHYK